MRTDGADGRWVLGSGGGAVAVFGTFQEAGCSLQEHVPGLCSERSCYLGNSARQAAGLRVAVLFITATRTVYYSVYYDRTGRHVPRTVRASVVRVPVQVGFLL